MVTSGVQDRPGADRPHVCLVVPNGTHRPGALARALSQHHPDLVIGAVWCGDPHLRPAEGDVPWWHVGIGAAEWHEALLANESLDLEWLAGLNVARRLLDDGAPSVTLLWNGSIAVLGDVSTLWTDRTGLVVVPRITEPLPDDGAVPNETSLAADGMFSDHIATCGRGSRSIVDWLIARLHADSQFGLRHWLALAMQQFPSAERCLDDTIGVGAWRWDIDDPVLLDVPGYDTSSPWVLDGDDGRRARVTVVGHDDRRRALDAAAGQLTGRRRPLTVPGGIEVDDVVRRLARDADARPPSAWNEPGAFRSWLADRYWTEVHASRRDLGIAFPHPTTTAAHAFRTWTRRAVIDDGTALLVAPLDADRSESLQFHVSPTLRPDGLNVVGYVRREASLGDVARRLGDALAAADVPTALLAHERTASPVVDDPPPTSRRVQFHTTVAVVNADQFGGLQLDHPELLAATRRMIGYWFWELEHIPRAMRAVIPMVDEIWAGSKFVTDAFAAVTSVPVRHVPIPTPEPVASDRVRSSFAPLQSADGRFVFAVVFDHFSITERKNPLGAIAAFKRAFAPDEGPLLVIKSMNGSRRWPQHQQVLAAAEDRADIVVWDHHLNRADHMAFIAAVDALVSLHRSEGLGLHLAEAMWLRTPTIATRYSGNLDFMDDECSLLIDATLVGVTNGEGVYPSVARWADPDLDAAADAMRRLATDPSLDARLIQAARTRMEGQPSLADTGRLVGELLQLEARS